MKFSTANSEFQKVLQRTLPAMPRKSTLPVLEHLSFTLTGNKLSIISTDQDITIMSSIEVIGEEDGSVLVPGRRLNEIIRAFNDVGTCEFYSDPENFDIKILTSFGNYNMKGLDPNEYLDLPELFESEKPKIEIKDGIPEIIPGKSLTAYFDREEINLLSENSVFAVSKDEYRPAMTGVLFQFKGDLVNAVSTDSFRLVKVTIKSEKPNFPNDFSVIIPARAVELLRKIETHVVFSFIENIKKITHVRFDFDETIMITRVIDEKFPPYESVIPIECKSTTTTNAKDMINAIKRVSIFANTNSNQVKLLFDQNSIELTAEDEDSGTLGKETIKCDYNGDIMLMGFNYRYLEEALAHLEGELENDIVVINFNEPNRPIILKSTKENSGTLMLIMPVRLG